MCWTIDAFANTPCKQLPWKPWHVFFFKVASKLYSHPRFTAHISHKLKHQRCFVSWLKKHPSFHRHGAWKFLLFQIRFWLKKCQETVFFLVSTYNTGDMYFEKIARNQFTSLCHVGCVPDILGFVAFLSLIASHVEGFCYLRGPHPHCHVSQEIAGLRDHSSQFFSPNKTFLGR